MVFELGLAAVLGGMALFGSGFDEGGNRVRNPANAVLRFIVTSGDASRLRFFGRPSAEGLSQNDKMMSVHSVNNHQGGV